MAARTQQSNWFFPAIRSYQFFACREDAEFRSKGLAEQASAPATIGAFKTHPLYVLTRHISKYQALRPGTTPVGTHKCALVDPAAPLS